MDEKETRLTGMLQKATMFYVVILLAVFPLVYHNNYIDIVQTKKNFFLVVSTCYVFTCIIGTALLHKKWNFNAVDICAFILMIGLLLSTFFSQNRFDAFWGREGRCFGAIVLIAAISGYFFVSRYFIMSQNILWAFLLGSGCVFILDILNTFQVDILNMKENLDPAQQYFFIGTMGNIDLEAEYAAIMLPIGMVLFYYAKETFSELIYGGYVFLGFAAMICCRCDTAVVCIITALLLFYWIGFESVDRLQKVQNLFLLWMIASGCIGMLRLFFWNQTYEFDGLCKAAVSAVTVFAELVCWGILEGYLYYLKKTGSGLSKNLRNIIYGILAFSFCIVSIIAILTNCGVKFPLGGDIFNCLRITDEFGNYRGYIWKRSVQAYADEPIFRKIFGYGMNQFPIFIRAYEEEMIQLYRIPFGDAHNEYLQILSTLGLVGAAGFFGMPGICLWNCLHKVEDKRKMAARMGILVFIIYFIQGIANNPQVFTTPLYFVFMGIVMKSVRKDR